jgi:hypothetical protein
MDGGDYDYFEERAEAELELAQRASDGRAVQAHYELAEAYLGRIHGETEGEAARSSAVAH